MASDTEITAFLSDPASYPERPESVDVIETHAARVFLAGAYAIKVKKHIRLPYLDFTTLAQRQAALTREFELNQPSAPDIYLGLRRITRASNGGLAFDGADETIEVALLMRRFARDNLLTHVAAAGGIDRTLAKAIADVVFDMHEAAPVATSGDGVARFNTIISDIEAALGSCANPQMRADRSAFADRAQAHLARVQPLLAARADQGFRRRCHGDLHLGNMVLWHGQPMPFDALEFDEELATIDILYDLAFLIMDLDHQNLRARANDVLNRYLWRADRRNLEGLAALPLFLALRAGIRAMVDVHRMASANSALPDVLDDAQHYLTQALTYLAPARPCLVAVGGLSGSGKSTLAARLAPTIGLSPGAIHVRSDLERKRLFGAAETERLPDEAYTRPVTEKVYAALNEMAAAVLATGHTIIVDAVHSAPHERAAVARIAEAAQVPFIGLWLDVPGRVLKDRVTARTGDASDATADVVARQLDYDLGDISWHRLDASGDLDALCERARDIIAASFGATTGKEPRP